MNITVSDEAVNWFKKELEVTEGDHVQFFARYGGHGDFQSGFSLGVTVKEPDETDVFVEKDGITFYVEKKDEWYFDGKDFSVKYDKDTQEISFKHSE